MERENIVFQRIADYVNRTIHLGEYAKEVRMTNVFRLLKKQYDKAVQAMQRVIGKYSVGNMILFWLFQYFTFTLLQEGLLPELPIRSVEFEHVSFGYREDGYVLKDIHFKIEGNQSVALAGYSGAGKSTLMKLLMRLYDPDEGRILVNGVDIREYQVRAYRELFATAFQNGRIFANTIEENILMGRHTEEERDRETVWRALRLAGMDEEVEGQPLREKTLLTREFSREGVVFSGGQNQKILAARAFAKDGPIAVFDEPSSALDPIAEYRLFENIREYGKDKILFFISHRLSSVRNADVVFYMKNGRIQERGSHGELMEQNGEYASLYRLQAKNYQT